MKRKKKKNDKQSAKVEYNTPDYQKITVKEI